MPEYVRLLGRLFVRKSRRVVLPQPLGPILARSSPLFVFRVRSWIINILPFFVVIIKPCSSLIDVKVEYL